MPFAINHPHYAAFIRVAAEAHWTAARRAASWAKGVGAEPALAETLSDAPESREYLKQLCADSSVGPEACFLAIMAWGGMKYSHGRTAWELRDAWSPIVERLRAGDLCRSAAYEEFRQFRLTNPRCGFGPAYYTKLIFFAAPAYDGYIMDQWTSVSINLLLQQNDEPIVELNTAAAGRQVSHYVSDKNRAEAYEAFCQGIEFLAAQTDLQAGLGISRPEEVEMRMFSQGGRRPGPWRDYVRRNYC